MSHQSSSSLHRQRTRAKRLWRVLVVCHPFCDCHPVHETIETTVGAVTANRQSPTARYQSSPQRDISTMNSMYLLMVFCVFLVNAEDSSTGSGSEPVGTQPHSSNDSASDLDTRHHDHDSYGPASCSVQTASCTNNGGACQGPCDTTTQLVLKGRCLGKCSCCTSKPATCTAFANCTTAKGSCSTTACLVTQKTVARGCTGSTCTCCAPRDCDPTTSCKRAGGFCAITCDKGQEVIANGCSGTQCQCCVRRCSSSHECREHSGVCVRRNCRNTEWQITNGCGGQGCRCCAPALRDAEETADIGAAEGAAAAEDAAGDMSEGEETNEETVVKQEGGEGGAEQSEIGEVEETVVRASEEGTGEQEDSEEDE